MIILAAPDISYMQHAFGHLYTGKVLYGKLIVCHMSQATNELIELIK